MSTTKGDRVSSRELDGTKVDMGGPQMGSVTGDGKEGREGGKWRETEKGNKKCYQKEAPI